MGNGNAIGNALAGLLVVGLIARVGRKVSKEFGKPIRGYGKKLKFKSRGGFSYKKHRSRKPILHQFKHARR